MSPQERCTNISNMCRALKRNAFGDWWNFPDDQKHNSWLHWINIGVRKEIIYYQCLSGATPGLCKKAGCESGREQCRQLLLTHRDKKKPPQPFSIRPSSSYQDVFWTHHYSFILARTHKMHCFRFQCTHVCLCCCCCWKIQSVTKSLSKIVQDKFH